MKTERMVADFSWWLGGLFLLLHASKLLLLWISNQDHPGSWGRQIDGRRGR